MPATAPVPAAKKKKEEGPKPLPLPDIPRKPKVRPPEPSGDYIESVFGREGFLSAGNPFYEERPGQVALARHVDAAIRGEHHALAEGPCGTGKGIAYAVPAIFHAHHHGKQTVIVTANLALQDQLILKDLPELQKALPWKFTFSALKGRSNYFCANKHAESVEQGKIRSGSKELIAAGAWGEETVTGDRRELPVIVENQEWNLLSTNSDECLGEQCAYQIRCHYERAKHIGRMTDIVVSNMHVLGAHLSLRQQTEMDLILPPFDILVVDEAHELPEVMREFFGFSLSESSIERFARRINPVSFASQYDPDRSRREIGKTLADRLRRASHDFFRDVGEYTAKRGTRLRLENAFLESKVDPKPLFTVLGKIQELSGKLMEEEYDETPDGERHLSKMGVTYKKINERSERMTEYVVECLGQEEASDKVYWVEFSQSDVRRMYPKIEARPLEVGGILNGELFAKTDSVILVSATLTTTPENFSFMRRETGIPREAPELAVPSPFDTGNQVLVIVPKRDVLPDNPNDEEFIPKAAAVVQEVMEACDGSTLGLFTSFRVLEGVKDRIRSEHPILVQERGRSANRTELIRRFKEDVHSSLLGTASFWTGIDIPGQALTAVVIDRLPFDHQDEPLIEAMKDYMAQEDHPLGEGDRFWSWYNNRALLVLRQAAGRLIRRQDDVGVIVILDRRIASKEYGKNMVRSLGPIRKSNKISDIAEHLGTARERVLENREAFMARQRAMPMMPKRLPPAVKAMKMDIPKGVF